MSLTSHVDVGDSVRASVTITDSAGAAADPTTLVLRILPPAGVSAETVLTYGTDAALVKDAVGAYHADIAVTAAGPWKLRWKGTGAAVFAEEPSFMARASSFTNP